MEEKFLIINNQILALREEMRQIIRMMEDAVIIGNENHLYLLIGKLVKIQGLLDELENVEEGWSNSDY